MFYKTIENDAAKRANSEDWSFRLSLLFIGFAREGVSVDTKYSQNLDLAREGGLKISKMSDGELAKIGSYQFDDKSQKYTLTLTGTTKFDTLPAGVTSETSAKGEVVLSSAEPFKISRIIHRGADNTLTDSGYQIVLGGKKVDKVTTIATPASVAPVNAPMDVKEKRMLEKGLPDALFFLGHVRDLKINHLVELLSKQDFDGAKTYLESITIQLKNGSTGKMETYTTLKKNLLANWDKAASFTTYMYGNRASKSKQEFTQEFVDSKVRKPDVVRAEKRLAAKYGINIEVPESAFSHQANGKIEAKSTEDIFPNQDKTISCFSTPLGGLHRIDTYDNNVTVSSKTVLIDDEAGRSQIFDATLKTTVETKGILAQVAKLNTYLGARGAVTVEQYKAYLVSGDVSKLGVAGLKEEKKPVFFEARAMIQ